MSGPGKRHEKGFCHARNSGQIGYRFRKRFGDGDKLYRAPVGIMGNHPRYIELVLRHLFRRHPVKRCNMM
jgi:hypothetical protein